MLVAVVVAVVVLLVLRYRALERAGTPLPPGAGGARLVGVEAAVVTAHRPPRTRGTVRVLGDDWGIADDVPGPLPRGTTVRVVEVVGTRLVVVPVTSRHDDHGVDGDPDHTDARSA